jgi:hypothetical protein
VALLSAVYGQYPQNLVFKVELLGYTLPKLAGEVFGLEMRVAKGDHCFEIESMKILAAASALV